jgi:hypothetical protein
MMGALAKGGKGLSLIRRSSPLRSTNQSRMSSAEGAYVNRGDVQAGTNPEDIAPQDFHRQILERATRPK